MNNETLKYDEIFYRRGNPRAGCCWFKGESGLDEALAWDENNSRNISVVEVTKKEEENYFKKTGIGYAISTRGFDYLDHTQRINVYREDDLLDFIDEFGSIRQVA